MQYIFSLESKDTTGPSKIKTKPEYFCIEKLSYWTNVLLEGSYTYDVD